MKNYLIVAIAILLSACSSLPEQDGGINGLSFVNFGQQPAAVFDNRSAQTVVYGDMQTGEVKVFSLGQWIPSAPQFTEPFQPDPSFDDKLIVPMISGRGFIFEPPTGPSDPQPEPDLRLILNLDRNPCIPNAGCGGGFGRRLARIFQTKTVYRCSDSDINIPFPTKPECTTACEPTGGTCSETIVFTVR